MKRNIWPRLLFIAALLVGGAQGARADVSIEGLYQGRNIYVQSPESEDGFGYCVHKVSVNGSPINSSISASAFQVDFTQFDIKIGDPVIVVFETDGECKPKVLNPEVLLPKSTFQLSDISCSPEGQLTWSTTNESGSLTYQIEIYRWNKWIPVGEVDGTGNENLNQYKFEVTPHSGENRVRVSQTDNTGKKHASKEVIFDCDVIAEPEMKVNGKKITFVANGKPVKTKYEVFDAYGNIVKKGYGSEIDCVNLKKGAYHINYDNKSEKFIQV